MDTIERVGRALSAAPRELFLPKVVRHLADLDRPLPIGYGATNSQPFTVRLMLELLDVPTGARVLDVGSGSGWTTALLAELCGPTGSVVGVELRPELVTMGRANLPPALTWARIELAVPGVVGLPSAAPFDRILVSADAGYIPSDLEAQLAPSGRMVLPAAELMWTVERTENGLRRRQLPGERFAFVPLSLTSGG